MTSTLLRTQNTTLLSKVRRRFFQILWPSQKTQTLKPHTKIAILFQKRFQPILNNLMIQLHRRNNFIVENIGPENIIGDQY